MKTIYKYSLLTTDRQSVVAPLFARPLYVDMQNGVPCIWAEVDTDAPMSSFRVAIVGTGNQVPQDGPYTYLGSFQNAPFVWHVYVGPRA